MGLEYVEFFMDIEDEFDIRISDEDSQEFCTCEDIAKYVMVHVPASRLIEQSRIPQKRFYTLRKALIREFNFPRHTIRPQTPWEQILTSDIKTQWKKLGGIPEINDLPRLRSDSNIPFFSTIFAILLFFVLLIAIDLSFWSALSLTFIVWFASLYFLTPEGDQIPETYQTIGALVSHVKIPPLSPQSSADELSTLPQNDTELMYTYVLHRVIQIAARVLNCPEETIHPSSHLYKDLAMGG